MLIFFWTDTKSLSQNGPLESVKRQFTYNEIAEITNNFDKSIGKGSFGTVYRGKLGNTQVAVKMLSESSVQGYREFLTEVSNYIIFFSPSKVIIKLYKNKIKG